MNNLIKLIMMSLILVFSFLLLASDSGGSGITFESATIELTEVGNLVINGKVGVFTEDEDLVVDPMLLVIDAELYATKVKDNECFDAECTGTDEECKKLKEETCYIDKLLLEKKNMEFTLEADLLTLTFLDSEVNMKSQLSKMEYIIKLSFLYTYENEKIDTIFYLPYIHIPE